MRYFQCLVLASSWVIGVVPVTAEKIKKTSSGICYPPESSWYECTENDTAYDSVEASLEADGRLPQRLKLASLSERQTRSGGREEYTRFAFGHGWGDADGDCQDSRAVALIAISTTTVRFADGDRYRVTTGRWISPFTGNVIQNSGEIDIDHVVPLAWSWAHGADDRSDEKRERFATDPVNMWPVEASLNRSKGAKGLDEWHKSEHPS